MSNRDFTWRMVLTHGSWRAKWKTEEYGLRVFARAKRMREYRATLCPKCRKAK